MDPTCLQQVPGSVKKVREGCNALADEKTQ